MCIVIIELYILKNIHMYLCDVNTLKIVVDVCCFNWICVIGMAWHGKSLNIHI